MKTFADDGHYSNRTIMDVSHGGDNKLHIQFNYDDKKYQLFSGLRLDMMNALKLREEIDRIIQLMDKSS